MSLLVTCVLVSPRGLAEVELTLQALRAQTIAPCLEVLVLAPQPESAECRSEVAFGAFRVIPVAPIEFRGHTAAIGVRQSSAPLVALVEDHAFPEPGWAEALVAAMTDAPPSTGVPDRLSGACTRFRNANPATLVSRVYALFYYAPLMRKCARLEIVDSLPWHNVIYRRQDLLSFEQPLEELLEPESLLQEALRRAGGRFGYVPSVATAHLSCSSISSLARAVVESARSHTVSRCRTWTLARKWLYVLASPVFPWLRMWHMRDRRVYYQEFGSLPEMALGIAFLQIVATVGEVVGLLLGPDPERWLVKHELQLGLRLNSAEMARFSTARRPGQGVEAPISFGTRRT